MEPEKYIDIKIFKYDSIFDKWLEETGSYIDEHCLIKVQKKFDESLGLVHHEYVADSKKLIEDAYRFKVIDGKKFMLAFFKYNLYDDKID